jgi:hypothetical protein
MWSSRIDASQQLRTQEELDTAAAMTDQVLTIFVQRQMAEEIAKLGHGDILIRIATKDMDPTDFMKAGKGYRCRLSANRGAASKAEAVLRRSDCLPAVPGATAETPRRAADG